MDKRKRLQLEVWRLFKAQLKKSLSSKPWINGVEFRRNLIHWGCGQYEPMEGGPSGSRKDDSRPVSANPQGVVEVLGQMDFLPSQMELTAAERRNLKR